ncbi:MAG: phosphate-starvation-inducible PsiE family protein [Acidiferrobacter sp.]
MLLFILLGIVIGVVHLFFDLAHILMRGHITTQYLELVGHVLTLFVLIEISRSLVQYFSVHRLRMTYIVDAALVFVLRDVMIGLFEKSLQNETIYALSALIFVLGALRIGSVLLFQREKPHEDHA